ncbi:MAG: 3'-5' exonuclease, partial [Acidimicrobiales bacterium]|nr:3'-5' exonuclease [Acidimicrobiales bacterium]
RRHLLHELRRKYGETLADVIAEGERLEARLAELEDHDRRAAELDAELVEARAVEAAAAADMALVVRLAQDHLRLDPGASAIGFVSWLIATLQSEGADEHRDAVTIATFHAAKGLEWPIVHLAGLEDGLVPITYARNQAQRGEEARLLYVAMTRAEDELRCTWAALRTFGGKPAERRLTPWLEGLVTRQRDRPAEPTGPPADWRTRLAEQRSLLADAVQPVSPTLNALHVWREEHARAARVEPSALIDDRLLEIIAERRPGSHDELVSIPGMGPLLAARVGDGLLAALQSPTGDTT